MKDCCLCHEPILGSDGVEWGENGELAHKDCADDDNSSRAEAAYFDNQYRSMEVDDGGDW